MSTPQADAVMEPIADINIASANVVQPTLRRFRVMLAMLLWYTTESTLSRGMSKCKLQCQFTALCNTFESMHKRLGESSQMQTDAYCRALSGECPLNPTASQSEALCERRMGSSMTFRAIKGMQSTPSSISR